jgi:hypothetical protein
MQLSGAPMSPPRNRWIPRPVWVLVVAVVPSLVAMIAWSVSYARQRAAAIEYARNAEGDIRFKPLPKLCPSWIQVPEWMQSVEFIEVHRGPFALRQITPLHELWGLQISGEVDQEGLQLLPRFRHLKRLIIDNRKVTDADLVSVGHCRQLELLSLRQPPITNDGLRSLAGLRLTDLSIEDTPIGNEGVRHLSGMPLRDLNLKDTWVSNKGVEHLAGMPLRDLNLEGTWITDASLAAIAKLPLERVNLSRTWVTPRGLRTLLESKTLQSIDVESRHFTTADINELQQAGVPVRKKPSKH